MTMTAEQKAARLEMIKAAAAKYNKRADFKRKQAINAAKVRRWTDEVERPARRAKADEFDNMIAQYDENHNQYTDGSKYLAEHYGERLAEQKSYESDWG